MNTKSCLAGIALQLLALTSVVFAQERGSRRPKLQILNGGAQTVDVFWLKPDGGRVPNGTIAPGRDTTITTTIGHRFAIVGHDDKAESIVTSEVPVQTFRVGGVPAFYTQRVEAHGFPIVASAKVSPYAVKEAAYLVDMMLAKRPEDRFQTPGEFLGKVVGLQQRLRNPGSGPNLLSGPRTTSNYWLRKIFGDKPGK